MIIDNWNSLEKDFYNFLVIVGSMCCGRCYMIKHHECSFNTLLKSIKKLDKDFIDNWINDLDHGFFHCLLVAFISYYYDQNIIGSIEEKLDFNNLDVEYINNHVVKYISSALLHDFLKCNGWPQEEHDIKLREYFPDLLEETYTHSNPSSKYDKSLLIIGDRTELRRYGDFQEWKKEEILAHKKLLKENDKEILDLFYNNLRPALLYIFKNRDDVFLRHGIENINGFDEALYPFKNSYSNIKEHTCYYKKEEPVKINNGSGNFYAIEMGKVPFADYYWKDSDEIHGSNCINHDDCHNWNMLKGIISLDDFKKFNGTIVSTNHRDHLYARSDIQINNWTFIHKVNYKFRGLDRYKIKPFDKKSYNNSISKLLKGGNRIVSQRIISDFFKVFGLLTCKMKVLN